MKWGEEMKEKREWKTWPFGFKLTKLHKWTAITIALLAITGLILYFPNLRGPLAKHRVLLKDLHIFLGIISILLLILYLPLLVKHLRKIWNKKPQRYNLWITLVLIIGWSVSGLILWQFRHLPAIWSSRSLVVHDLFSYVGIPWFLYHTFSRSRSLKRIERQERKEAKSAREWQKEPNENGHSAQSFIPRRTFIRLGLGGILLFIIGPFLWRWMKGFFRLENGVVPEYGSKPQPVSLQPEPTPLPGSLPPKGGGGDGIFRPYTVTKIPTFTSGNWAFSVDGLVTTSLAYDWGQFLKLKRKVQVSDFHCVTGWSVYHVTWEGIPLTDLLNEAGVKPEARYVKFYSGDGVYTDTLTLEQASMEDTMVAILVDGKPISASYGGPARLIVPKMYGYKSVKWLNRIELIDHPHTGYWEKLGYDTDAWYRG